MKVALKNITNIQTGVFAKPEANGDLIYLQPKYFDSKGELKAIGVPDLNKGTIKEKHFLTKGDVLFSSKGFRNFAVTINDEMLPAVASTSFFVIRITNDKILPEYLKWYLNQPSSLQVLSAFARGTAIPSITKGVLGDLEISIPSIEKQKMILKIDNLTSHEKRLKLKITSLREAQIQQQIINALK